MALIPRFALARSYSLSANLTATVTDNGGAGRAVTIAASGSYVRPFLAASGGGGTSTTDPYELFARAGTQLSTGSGGGTWTVSWHTNATTGARDGRVRLGWTGVGTGTVSAGGLLAALGFTGTTGAISSGSYATSAHPPLGLLLWAVSQPDGDWMTMQKSAHFQDEATVARRAAGSVFYRRALTAYWLPRVTSANASNEYLSPVWAETAYAGAASASAPDPSGTATPWSWLDGIHGIYGQVAHGFTDDFTNVTTSGYVSEVYVAPSVFESGLSLAAQEAQTYRQRKNVELELYRTRALQL